MAQAVHVSRIQPEWNGGHSGARPSRLELADRAAITTAAEALIGFPVDVFAEELHCAVRQQEVGTARVTGGADVYLVPENQSTYIPLGEKHRLDNPGKVPLEMIEVQSGSYLGEDDIVRFEDVYGR